MSARLGLGRSLGQLRCLLESGRATQGSSSAASGLSPLTAAVLQQSRPFGGAGVPEFWGKKSPYTGGTDFLGTPPDHLKRVGGRPVSPHVFETDGKSFHYKMPINAVTSVTNRFTGVALTVGMWGAGAVALLGDLPAAVDAFVGLGPWAVLPAKAAVAFPLVYHYLGGVRHVYWDHYKYPRQADHETPLDNKSVEQSSRALVAGSVVGTLGLALLSV